MSWSRGRRIRSSARLTRSQRVIVQPRLLPKGHFDGLHSRSASTRIAAFPKSLSAINSNGCNR